MQEVSGNTNQAQQRKRGKRRFVYAGLALLLLVLFYSLFTKRIVERNVTVYYAHGSAGTLSHTVRVMYKAKGFAILQKDIRGYQIDLTDQHIPDVFPTNAHPDYFSPALPDHAEVLSVYPHVFEKFPELRISKKIPIQLRTILRLRDNFMISDSLHCYPDSITITGPKSIIERTIAWSTEPVYINSRDTTYIGTAVLFAPVDDRVTLSHIAVRYSVRVAQFQRMSTDLSIAHPLTGEPMHVQVVYTAPMHKKNSFTASDFTLVAEPDSLKPRYKLKCVAYPDDIYTIRVVPSFIHK